MRRIMLGFVSLILALSGQAVGLESAQANTATGGTFVPVTPQRLVNAGTWAGGSGRFSPGETKSVQVLGTAGIPATGVSSVVVDITAHSTTATTSNFLTAWRSGASRPVASNLFFTQESAPRTNTAIVEVGSDGKINIYNHIGNTAITVDLQGYFNESSGAGGFSVMDPTRIANTAGSANGANVPQKRLAVGEFLDVQASGVSSIDANATAVFANVEVRNAISNGALWIGPGGSSATWPQSMEYGNSGPNDSGRAIPLNAAGQFRIRNLSGSPVDLKIDIQGFFTTRSDNVSAFTSRAPTTIYATGFAGDMLKSKEKRTVQIGGLGGLPNDGSMGAAVLTIAAKMWTAGGTVTAYSADLADTPGTTNVSFNAGEGEPGAGISSTAVVRTSIDGKIILHNTSSQPVAITLTTQGWFSRTNSLLDTSGSYAPSQGTLLDTSHSGAIPPVPRVTLSSAERTAYLYTESVPRVSGSRASPQVPRANCRLSRPDSL